MFFLTPLEHTVYLHPRHCGTELRTTLFRQLHEEVEGKCHGRWGFIICVHNIKEIGDGIVKQGTGLVSFHIKYDALTFHPFQNQVVDAIVTSVNNQGFWADVGALSIFVKNMPSDFQYDGQGAYVSADQTVKISIGNAVRIQIINYRIHPDGMSGVGSMAADYLGKLG
ncbi:MAG: RPB7/RPC8 family DNA-directed RNA polymerase subunit [archaeon]|nr:RPB7/RPC8 family DNA-directed RNA polymerase subunit [archaeon]